MPVVREGVDLIPVRALVWLRLTPDGKVEEAELSADTSWMTLDPVMIPCNVVDGAQTDLSADEAQTLLDALVESDKWRSTEVTLDV